jgi:hypothetical protein
MSGTQRMDIKVPSAQGKWQEHSLRTLATKQKRLNRNKKDTFDTERNGAGELIGSRPSRATSTAKFSIADWFQKWLSGTLRMAAANF